MNYIEPFVGGANMIDKISDEFNKIADNNKYLIEMFNGLIKNKERPYIINKEDYVKARNDFNNKSNDNYSDFLIGWIGWMASYNGRFFDGGYSGHRVGTKERDYISEQIRNTEKQISNIRNVNFVYSDYKELEIPTNSLIYCDIPYKNTKQYSTSKGFNHSEFWDWAYKQKESGNIVLVSEYTCEINCKVIWEKEVTNSMNQQNTYKPIEKLFEV